MTTAGRCRAVCEPGFYDSMQYPARWHTTVLRVLRFSTWALQGKGGSQGQQEGGEGGRKGRRGVCETFGSSACCTAPRHFEPRVGALATCVATCCTALQRGVAGGDPSARLSAAHTASRPAAASTSPAARTVHRDKPAFRHVATRHDTLQHGTAGCNTTAPRVATRRHLDHALPRSPPRDRPAHAHAPKRQARTTANPTKPDPHARRTVRWMERRHRAERATDL